jgi:hypothetical protein
VAEQNPFDKFDASDFVNLALSPIPSTFGRLAFLADLRDHHSEPLAEMLYGKEQISAAIQKKHRELFFAWLGLSQSSQMEEVAEYLVDLDGNHNATIAQLVQRWTQEKLYEQLSFTAASESERELFSNAVRDILQLLHNRFGSSGDSSVG